MTGYFDMQLSRDFSSCAFTKKNNFPEKLWAPNQPDNDNGFESCVSLKFYPYKTSGYYDVTCMWISTPICQVQLLFSFYKKRRRYIYDK